ncbi:ComF family protein [Rhodococcus artemisiae]|uniref:ComF family protein n=1 Tax=Rhodococcus artemisiae TaxID=714159 RepID=A0ABU7L8A2_9NOCA|nr:ComF family protein [Rhodococcus artemisiae]MEE2057539.1 ComF family protein [Rhodococcus artemisiae]
MLSALLDLVLPVRCGGCDAPGTPWCRECARVLNDPPAQVHVRVDPGVPVWALGAYSGVRRNAVVAAKERGRRDLAAPLGLAAAVAVARLRRWGELPAGPLIVVPAPTRARAARARGGDPVTRMARCAASHDPTLHVHPMLVTGATVRDSVGLSASQRQDNLAGRISIRADSVPRSLPLLVIDDIVTTGATTREAVRVLRKGGFRTSGILVIARA